MECISPVGRHAAREIARTLNEDRRHLPREQRLPVVAALRESGHSIRAISGATGVSPRQVQRDLAGVASATPATNPPQTHIAPGISVPQTAVAGLDGKSYPADLGYHEARSAAVAWRRLCKAIAGLDGKSYPVGCAGELRAEISPGPQLAQCTVDAVFARRRSL